MTQYAQWYQVRDGSVTGILQLMCHTKCQREIGHKMLITGDTASHSLWLIPYSQLICHLKLDHFGEKQSPF